MASWAGIPIINHIHGAEFNSFYVNASPKKKKLIERAYGKCSVLIALSDEWKDNLSQIVPSDKIKIVENYSTLHEEAMLEKSQRKSNHTILFLGEIGKRKGCYDIPEIVAKVSRDRKSVV